jgi:hypothetical protein
LTKPLSARAPSAPMALPARLRLVRLTRPLSACAPLGPRIGITAVLHTWGSAMTHHPHLHMIVPGGGLSLDGKKWLACRHGFLLPVRVLSRLFRQLFLKMLADAHAAGRLAFFGDHAALVNAAAFAALLTPLRKAEWVVYAKKPFGAVCSKNHPGCTRTPTCATAVAIRPFAPA